MNIVKENDYIDLDLYSRQIGTFGINTMQKIIKLKILIIGLKGLGIEVAKNTILAGPKEVWIFDPKLIQINDLGSNFYLKEEHVGIKRRDEACLEDLKKLNPYTKVSILKLEKENNDIYEYFSFFNIIIITEFTLNDELIKINEFCRKNKLGFIYGANLGLTGFLFNDFGDEHYILDKNGKQFKKYFCKDISNEKNAKVILDEKSENIHLKIDSYVIFNSVNGMTELNDRKPIKIINKEKNILTLDIDTTSYGKYLNRGFLSQAKIPLKKSYKSLKDRLSIPYEEDSFNQQDYEKEGRNELLFICLKGLNEFCLNNNGNLPDINNYQDAKKFIEITKNIYEEERKKDLLWSNSIQIWDEKIVEKFCLWCRCEIPCLTSFLGGFISQEIIKYTGKYIPIDQWMFFDFFEAVEPLENKDININIINDRKILCQSRYNNLISIFGNQVYKNLTKKNIFMIGAGAVGCEFLKNLSLIGFSTDENGEKNNSGIITVTDNDNIAISNLNRQFLFHKENVNQPKSKCACNAAKAINKNMNIKCYNELVCFENENLFNDEFWNNQDYIICAVDSVEGRKYIDKMCLKYDKILTDSGTDGVEGRFQLIIPYLTSCISDIDYKANYVPSCTLKSYPTKYEHCVEWSKSFFNDEFNLNINELITYLNKNQQSAKNNNEINVSDNEEEDIIKKIYNYIILISDYEKSKNINIFREYALFKFNELFKEEIDILFKINPKLINNQPNSFWNNIKIPHVLDFDEKDPICNLFIQSLSKILCRIFGIIFIDSNNIIDKSNIKFYSEKHSDKINLDSFLTILKDIKIKDYYKKIKPEIFDKDNFMNSHIDFIYSCSILRARNFNIPEEDENKTHLISGNIISSIPSINPIIAGILSLQLIILSYTKDFKYLRKGFVDLSDNTFTVFPPSPAKVIEDEKNNIYLNLQIIAIPKGFTKWTKILIKESKTCKEFIDFIKNEYNVNVSAIFADNIHIYQKYNIKNEKKFKEMNENLNNTIESIYYKKLKKLNVNLNNKLNKLFLSINGKIDNNYVKMPLFQYEY